MMDLADTTARPADSRGGYTADAPPWFLRLAGVTAAVYADARLGAAMVGMPAYFGDFCRPPAPEAPVALTLHLRALTAANGARPAANDPALSVARRRLETVYRRFPPQEEIRSVVADLHHFATDPCVYAHLQQFAAAPDSRILHCRSSFLVCAAPAVGSVFACIRDDVAPGPLRLVNCCLYFAFAVMLHRVDGLLVHAAGVRRQNGAQVFLAHSGAGKTTLAAAAAPGDVLADDGLVLRCRDGIWHAYPTPWHIGREIAGRGRLCANRPYPVRGVQILEQAPENRLTPIPAVTAAALMLRHFIHCFRHFDDAGARRTFDLCADLFDRHPCRRLRFTRDLSFWPLLATPNEPS